MISTKYFLVLQSQINKMRNNLNYQEVIDIIKNVIPEEKIGSEITCMDGGVELKTRNLTSKEIEAYRKEALIQLSGFVPKNFMVWIN